MNIIDIFNYQNPWRKNKNFKVTPYFKRSVLPQIENWMSEPEIIVLIGPRQSGKTTILLKLIEKQLNQKYPQDSLFFFNCDSFEIRSLFENLLNFIQFIDQLNPSPNSVILIDEIQRIANPGLFLKQIYDLKLNYKIIVSGSSSLEIRSKIKETLTGRKIVFNILPLNFEELIIKDPVYDQLLKIPSREIEINFSYYNQTWGKKLQTEFEQYLIYGGYPRILLTQQIEKKKQILNEIYTSYIQKDISDFLKIENISGFNKLIQFIALTSGQVINKSDICLKTSLSHHTMDKYIQALQDTFIIETVQPYFTNKIKEIIKNPKLYFLDPGIRNLAISNFNPTLIRQDTGFLQETFLFRELKSFYNNYRILKFWRTKVGAEVDFIIDKGEFIYPIECKSILKKPGLSRSFQNFIKLYKPAKGFVINHNLFTTIKIANSEITFIPYHWFPILKKQFFH